MADLLNNNPEITPHDQEVNQPIETKPEHEAVPENITPPVPMENQQPAVPEVPFIPHPVEAPQETKEEKPAPVADGKTQAEALEIAKTNLYEHAGGLDPHDAVENLEKLLNSENPQQ